VPYDAEASLAVQVRQSVQRSLKNLRVEWLDCLVLHSPLPSHVETMTAWRAMEAEVSAGNARSLGVSNCYDARQFSRIWEEATIKPAVLQNRFYRETKYDGELRAFCGL